MCMSPGATSSSSFPVSATAFQKTGPTASNGVTIPVFAFVTVLSPTLDQVQFSTYLGSSQVDCVVGDACGSSSPNSTGSAISIAVDGSIVIAGFTNSSGFPVTQGASETVCNCSFEFNVGFVVSFKSDLSALNWSTFLGAAAPGTLASTMAEGIAPESDGSVIVAGNTSNATFPTTAGAFQGTLHTLTSQGLPGNLFVTRFDSSGTVLSSTYLGGSTGEQLGSLELDATGNPWLTGTTQSPDFPLLAGSPRLGSGFLAGLSSDGTKLIATQTFPNGAAGTSFTFLPNSEVAVLGSDLIVLPLTATSSPEILGIASATGTAVTNQVAPGELIAIYGLSLGPAQGAPGSFDATGQLPTTLGGVQVLGNGSPLPLLYVSANQINTVIPFGLTLPIVLQVSGTTTSAMVTLPQVIADPSVFSSGSLNGFPEVIAINQDGTLNSAANPAAPGSIVAMWVNGAGAFQASYPDGSQFPTTLSSLAAPVAVLFDGETEGGVTSFGFQSVVTYAGVAPGLVAGIAQVNFQIPTNLPTPGDSTMNLLVGQDLSPTYSIAIQ